MAKLISDHRQPVLEETTASLPTLHRLELVPIVPERGALVTENDHFTTPAAVPFWRRHWMLLGIFVFPVTVAVVYFWIIAADIYISEAKFIVRSASRTDGSGISMIMQTQGMARTVDETYAVDEYMLSRDAAAQLARESGLREIMSRDEGDMFGRYPNLFSKQNEEQFYRAYQRTVDVSADATTGISVLQVRTFRPEDATALATALLKAAESFVNRLNVRAHQDTLAFSETLVKEAQSRLSDVERRLADYRNTQLVVDPERESTQSLAMLGKMATEISRLEATLAQQMAMAPESPSNAPLRERISAYRAEMQKQQKAVVGGSDSIATKLQAYELLMLERELAARTLAAAVTGLESARQESQAQRIYLQTIAEPNRPDQPLQPRRTLGILIVAVLAFCAYWVVRTSVKATMDHHA